MKEQKVYIYGIIPAKADPPRDCGGIGVPPLKVEAIPMGGVAVLGSYISGTEAIGIEDAVRHMQVLERMMSVAPVIPVKFGTVVGSLDELRKLLTFKAAEILKELKRLEGKFEVGIKAYWNKGLIAGELARRYGDHDELVSRAGKDRWAAVELGQRVESVVGEWRNKMEEQLHSRLSRNAEENALGEPMSVEMVYNASFLVTPEQEEALKRTLDAYSARCSGKIEFHYTTRLPPYNFVRLDLSWRDNG